MTLLPFLKFSKNLRSILLFFSSCFMPVDIVTLSVLRDIRATGLIILIYACSMRI